MSELRSVLFKKIKNHTGGGYIDMDIDIDQEIKYFNVGHKV